MRILLVDDDEIIRTGMKKIIMNAGRAWEVVAEATDGEVALQKLKEYGNIQLIITDVRMPIMDGIELIKRVRETDKVVKIIVLSGYDEFAYVREAFTSGAVDYLLKPFHKKDFLARIELIENDILAAEREASSYMKNRHVIMSNVVRQLLTGERIPDHIQELEQLGVCTRFPFYLVMAIRADLYYKEHLEICQYQERLQDDLDIVLENCAAKEHFDYCYCLDSEELTRLFDT